MKRILVAVLFTLAISPSVDAQEVTLTSKVRGNYLGSNGALFYEGFVVQTDVFVKWKSGLYGDFWTSTAPNTKKDFDKELDFVVGYASKVGHVNYAVDLDYFAVQQIDVTNINAEASLDQVLSPFARIELYAPISAGGPRRGVMAIGGLRSALQMNSKIKVVLEQYVRHDSGCFGFDSGVLLQGYAGLSYALRDNMGLSLGAKTARPLSHLSDGRHPVAIWEVAFSQSF